MYRYFKTQIKRFIKISPIVFTLSLIFFVGAALLLLGFKNILDNDSSRMKFRIGVTGDTDDKYFQIGMTALNTMDTSRFSLELLELEEEKAEKMLENGDLSAYLVIPDGFVKSVTRGDVLPITFVSLNSNSGLVGIIKDEITTLIESMVLSGQKGVFASENVLADKGYDSHASDINKEANIAFVTLAIARESFYNVNVLGASSGLGAYTSFFCGIIVLFVFISGTVYAVVIVRRDNALPRLLVSRRCGITKQIIGEFFALTLSFFSVIGVIVGIGMYFAGDMLGTAMDFKTILISLLPLCAFVSAFNLFIFEITDKIVTGILLQFFSTLFMSYMSGCLYPISSLTPTLQRVAPYLPTGKMRMLFESALADNGNLKVFSGVLLYILVFLVITAVIRTVRVRRIV